MIVSIHDGFWVRLLTGVRLPHSGLGVEGAVCIAMGIEMWNRESFSEALVLASGVLSPGFAFRRIEARIYTASELAPSTTVVLN